MHPYLKRLETEAAEAEGVKDGLTVADILKEKFAELIFDGWILSFYDGEYTIDEIGGECGTDHIRRFQSSDESAAVAEFLRLTEGE